MPKTQEFVSIEEIEKYNLAAYEPDLHQRLSRMIIKSPIALAEINKLDPYSPQYRQKILELYDWIRGSEEYIPERDEQIPAELKPTEIKNISPWDIRDTEYFSEFLASWGQIFKLLDLRGSERVLEYGSGSGQILLMLSRLGYDTYGVDISEEWLDIVRAQAATLDLNIKLEKNFFGEGFEGETFDRIVFFEAFHHCLDFVEVLDKLKAKLSKGGYILFSGEPISMEPTDTMPYPWGPRLDGLSVYCIRKFGWMELGFTQEFFFSILTNSGYDVEFHPHAECFRAHCYIARPSGRARGEIVDPARHASRLKRLHQEHRPKPWLKPVAEFFLTVGRASKTLGDSLWSR